MLLPMAVRSSREPHGRMQYEPFRETVFTNRRDDFAAARGPGALTAEKWKDGRGNGKSVKSQVLYRAERILNPTRAATVQTFYDPQDVTNVGSSVEKKGNAVASFKSIVPRFSGSLQVAQASQRGPGSYFPDRYHGAFPALFDQITPSRVRIEKLQMKHALDATFGIKAAPLSLTASSPLTIRERQARRHAFKTADESNGQWCTDLSFESIRLFSALTPRNTYSSVENRRMILAMRPSEHSISGSSR